MVRICGAVTMIHQDNAESSLYSYISEQKVWKWAPVWNEGDVLRVLLNRESASLRCSGLVGLPESFLPSLLLEPVLCQRIVMRYSFGYEVEWYSTCSVKVLAWCVWQSYDPSCSDSVDCTYWLAVMMGWCIDMIGHKAGSFLAAACCWLKKCSNALP